MRPSIERKKSGTGFSYERRGKKFTDGTHIERIESLAIPPAWSDVKIALNPRAKIQVEGRDVSGKKQYIYSAYHIALQEAAKFDRTVQFGLKLPTLRRRVRKDLKHRKLNKDKVIACAVALMDKAYLRVGNEKYAKQNSSYGLTTLRHKHVSVQNDIVIFDYVGKSGKQQHKEVKDQEIARIIRKLDSMPGYEIFRYYNHKNELVDLKSDDVNQYIRDIMGDVFSAKDFRTWGGTLMAARELARNERSETETGRNQQIAECVERVAEVLGNTPAVARESYIAPRILEIYEKSDTIAKLFRSKRLRNIRYLSNDEHRVIKLLSSK
jgi:DNA topoisomerase-1